MLIPMPPGTEDEPPRSRRTTGLSPAAPAGHARCAAKLMARNILGRDVFGRGNPEPLIVEPSANMPTTSSTC